ncbi:MAG: branched-chain amino acid ABC transporter permease [Acidimicrobiia bacterium]|nr:branched-chain amino acid ABC transporter permease [Acidimicrobiia bacterium]MBA3802282.1 branched-chain amino acid ABC transporter permease [Acidimicrobiia bacterium]
MNEALRARLGWIVGAVLAVGLTVVLIVTGEENALVIGVTQGSAYGMVALGLVLVYKSSGVFNFAQGEFGTVALFVLYLLDFETNYWLAMAGALAVAAVMGFLTERIVIRPLFEAPRVILLVATAGVALLAIGVQIWFGDAQGKPIDKAFDRVDRITVLGVQVTDQQLALIVVLVALAALLALFFTKSNLGLAIIGASQEPTATELVGISVKRLSSFIWVIAAVLGGLAAVIAVPNLGSFGPGIMTSQFLIPAFTAAVLGGMTSLPGAFVGGVLIGIVQSVATSAPVFQDIPGTKSTLVVFIVLLVVLLIRPQGLLGKPAR